MNIPNATTLFWLDPDFKKYEDVILPSGLTVKQILCTSSNERTNIARSNLFCLYMYMGISVQNAVIKTLIKVLEVNGIVVPERNKQ